VYNVDKPIFVRCKSGSTFTEVIFAAAIVTGLAISILTFSTKIRTNLVTLTSYSECQSTATSILSSIKGLDNGTVIRTFLPTRVRPVVTDAVPGTNSDPYCKTVNRTSVCDTYNLLNMNAGGVVMNGAPLYNSQNIRGAATWAQAMFNRFVPNICTGDGWALTRADLERILPNTLPLPTWLQNTYLFIREEGIGATACNVASVSRIGANSSNEYEVGVKIQGDGKNCETKARVSFPHDRDPTTLTVAMTNGNGDPIPNIPAGTPACTCRQSFQALGGAPCPGMNDVNIALTSSEPGTILLCRKNGPLAEIDPVNEWKSCGDVSYPGSNITFNPDLRNNVVFNQPLQTTWTLGNLANSVPADPYEIGIRDVDVGGNITPAASRFRVEAPTCPDRDTYCVNATPAGVGILFLPRDSCDIDNCPPGSHSQCDAVTAQQVCIGNTFQDDCGNDICPGERNCAPPPPPPGPCIADNALCGESGAECGSPSYDNCGNCCSANGWYQYDAGYLPYNTNCPLSCGMTGAKYRRYLCTPVGGAPAQSAGTPEACGGPPPPPPPPVAGPPWSWDAGMYQCTDRNGRQTCNFGPIGRGVIPAIGYSRYEADIRVNVIAHDGSADEMFTHVRVTICSGGNCDTFTADADPLFFPKNIERPWVSGTIGVAAAGAPTVSIWTRVDEATTKTFVTVRAVP
jgi:hypothetical protein